MNEPSSEQLWDIAKALLDETQAYRLQVFAQQVQVIEQQKTNHIMSGGPISMDLHYVSVRSDELAELMKAFGKLLTHIHEQDDVPEFRFGDRVKMVMTRYGKPHKGDPVYGTYVSLHSHNPDAPPGQKSIRHYILRDGDSEPMRFKSTDFTAVNCA